MANSIALFKQYIPALDEVYKEASLSSVLDGNADLARQGANADELIIPKMQMDGLGAYSRNSGYVNGDVTLTNETVKCNYDRGRMFTVDALDDIETASIAFGRLAGEFIRTKVVPEIDAFRFAKYAAEAGTKKEETLATGEAVIAALRTATNTMDEDEVPQEGRILFITPTLKGMIDDLETIKSKEVLARFSQIKLVPQSRFYTKITQYDGTTSGQTAGGYVKAADGSDLNFLAIHPTATIQYPKHTVNKVISPEANQTSDGWKFGYRTVGIAEVYENKVAGIYASFH
jgi:hypothetical protein